MSSSFGNEFVAASAMMLDRQIRDLELLAELDQVARARIESMVEQVLSDEPDRENPSRLESLATIVSNAASTYTPATAMMATFVAAIMRERACRLRTGTH